MAIGKDTLDHLAEGGCAEDDCHHKHGVLYLHGRCHVGGPVEVSYVQGSGILRVACAECSRVIADVAVAERGIE